MTKKRPGAVRGRPPIGDAPLDEQIVVRVPVEVKTSIGEEAAARGVEPSVVVREILTRWAARQAKG